MHPPHTVPPGVEESAGLTMISLRELLAYGKNFMDEENQDSGGEFDLVEGSDRWVTNNGKLCVY